jgi:hypothetical protein
MTACRRRDDETPRWSSTRPLSIRISARICRDRLTNATVDRRERASALLSAHFLIIAPSRSTVARKFSCRKSAALRVALLPLARHAPPWPAAILLKHPITRETKDFGEINFSAQTSACTDALQRTRCNRVHNHCGILVAPDHAITIP